MKDVVVSYGKTQVLRGVDLDCMSGESVCLAGVNGAGKTTLLSVAAGVRKVDGGSVLCQGKSAFVPQDKGVLPELTVTDNLRLWYAAWQRGGERLYGQGSPEHRLGLMPHSKKRASQLSGGLQKRLALACALLGEPKLLLLDEPFAGLDVPACVLVIELLEDFCARGGALLFTSHVPWCIRRTARRVLLLEDGRIAEEWMLTKEDDAVMSQILGRLAACGKVPGKLS